MRSPEASSQPVCCDSKGLCQHPDCWRYDLQRVREAVWRRNGIKPEHSSTTTSMNVDQVYLTKEQRLESTDGGLPTLKVIDMFSDLDDRIKSAPDRHLRQPSLHRRSTSLPSLSPDRSHPTTSPHIRMPHPSPVISQSARTEYQRKMLWKKQFTNPSRAETSLSRESANTVKVATIGVHEVYEPEELFQEWEEVYVTSAYLVWCPSNKKKRKKRTGSSASSISTTKRPGSNKVIPKDVTEDFVPAAMETIKTIRPKSTKTPTGGQPFSPHKSPANQSSLRHYGMEDLSDLPKPILSGMLKRIAQRSTEATPDQDHKKEPDMASSPTQHPTAKTKKLLDGVDLSADFDSFLAKEERASKVHLAVDINSRFTTPAEDEELEKQKEMEKSEKEKQEVEAPPTNLNVVKMKGEEKQASREILRLNSIGVPMEDLPSPKSHHCMNSIPRRLSLGAVLEPVNIVPIEGSPATTPPNEPRDTQLAKSVNLKSKRSKKMNEVFVNIPQCRASSALERSPHYGEEDRLYVHHSFRNSPSPVRAPAPTPCSPDKHSEFFRQHSRISHFHRSASLQEEDMLTTMRRSNTLSHTGDAGEPSHLEGLVEDPIAILRGSPVGRQETEKNQDVSEERIFLTEGFETSEKTIPFRPNTPEASVLVDGNRFEDTRGRSPSPGSRTRIPKDIIEEFRGNLYGKQFSKAEAKAKQKASKAKEIVLGPKITASGWRPPRSRTPIQFAETPARFAPRPLKQPPPESVPKSLHIVPIPTLQRPRSTPPRITTPNSDYIGQVLSESSLHNNGSSVEVHGPSVNLSGTGSVPPPPSPEALVLPGDLNLAVSTLEPLCEEDERSSRTTSIAEFAEKSSAGNPRLSPLGGGSVVSEESIDLPKELCEDLDGNEGKQENREEKGDAFDKNEQQSKVAEQDNPTDAPRVEDAEEQVKEDEGSNDGKDETLNEPHTTELPPDTNPLGVTSEPTEPRPGSSDELQSTESRPDTNPLGVTSEPKEPRPGSSDEFQSTESRPDTNPLGVTSEPKEPRPGSSDELQSTEYPSESPKETSPARGSPEPAHQRPGSPDVTPDFTEGVDMNLDLTAQLQAAMEGLDDFDLDDDDDDDDDDERDDDIDKEDDEGSIDIKEETDDKNSDPINEESEINKDQDTDIGDVSNDNNIGHTSDIDEDNVKDDDDDKMIPDNNDDHQNMDHTSDKETDINADDGDDKMISDIINNEKNMDEIDEAQNKVDQEENYFDRSSPLLDA